jgi:hypothetical protein
VIQHKSAFANKACGDKLPSAARTSFTNAPLKILQYPPPIGAAQTVSA